MLADCNLILLVSGLGGRECLLLEIEVIALVVSVTDTSSMVPSGGDLAIMLLMCCRCNILITIVTYRIILLLLQTHANHIALLLADTD